MVLSNLGPLTGRVLDLYAGSGSLGLEALSRGASWVDFVDVGYEQVSVIKRNLEAIGFAGRGKVVKSRVETFVARALGRAGEPYDLIFVDPPYNDPGLERVLEMLPKSPLVRPGTLVAVGHSPRHQLQDSYHGLARLVLRCLGDSCYSIYRYYEEEIGG